MILLENLDRYALSRADTLAFFNPEKEDGITYAELKQQSEKLAAYLAAKNFPRQMPVVVYGHKRKEMLVAFLACVKAGHPYCPVDISMPASRLQDILEVSESRLLIKLEPTEITAENVLTLEDLQRITLCPDGAVISQGARVSGDEVFYIIFTSGSTGKPKGVQITANDLDNFLAWSVTLGDAAQYEKHNVFLNQAPFSFDLSVMDVYTSLYTGGTIWALDKSVQASLEKIYDSLGKSNIGVWVSTPSFMNMCLMNKAFDETMLPALRIILFCGEILTKQTAAELLRRFPKAKVMNTYGPTESTVAVTQIEVTEDLLKEEGALSIGYAKPGSPIYIMKDGAVLPEGERGEIVITGNTLAKGYLNQPELTGEKFGDRNISGKSVRGYLTGDEGFCRDGKFYYCGRMDFQLKLHGYRIELGDIENNIIADGDVRYCVVLPIIRQETVKALAAVIVPAAKAEDEFAFSQTIRKKLMQKLPEYMIPQKYVFMDKLPMTTNGKVDRRALQELI